MPGSAQWAAYSALLLRDRSSARSTYSVPVQVVGLVLDDPGLPAGEFPSAGRPSGSSKSSRTRSGRTTTACSPLSGEAAFEERAACVADGAYRGFRTARNSSGVRSRDGSSLGVDVELVLQDRELQGNAQLRGGEPDARGLVHHPPHQGQ